MYLREVCNKLHVIADVSVRALKHHIMIISIELFSLKPVLLIFTHFHGLITVIFFVHFECESAG